MFSNCAPLQISDAVYRQVLSQTTGQYEALVEACEAQRVSLDASLRTDMDQIITSKEHVSNKIRGNQRSTCNSLFFMTLGKQIFLFFPIVERKVHKVVEVEVAMAGVGTGMKVK